ncbi:unnamed protein product, partial [Allacma fusca]
MLNKVASMQ